MAKIKRSGNLFCGKTRCDLYGERILGGAGFTNTEPGFTLGKKTQRYKLIALHSYIENPNK